MQLLDRLEHLQPVQPRALKPNVEEDQVRTARRDRPEGFVGVPSRAGVVPLVAQYAGDELSDVFFVVNDQNVVRHHAPPTWLAIALVLSDRTGAAPAGGSMGNRIRTQAPLPEGASSNSRLPP